MGEEFESTLRDSLTKLYNEVTANTYIEYQLQSIGEDERVTFFLIDINNLNELYEKLGYVFIGEILANAAEYIQMLFGSFDIIARKEKNGFIIFSRRFQQESEVQEMAEEVCKRLQQTVRGFKETYEIRVSIGIVHTSRKNMTCQDLHQKAELAISAVTKASPFEIYQENRRDEYEKMQKELSKQRTDKLWKVIGSDEKSVDFNYELMDYALKLIEETKDVGSAIQMILRKVGEFYGLSSVLIEEQKSGPNSLKCTYEWTNTEEKIRLDSVVRYTEEEWYRKQSMYDSGSNTYSFSFQEKEQALETDLQYYHKYGVKSILKSALYNNGIFIGDIVFVDKENYRIWSQGEVKTIRTLCRILISCLLKLRAYGEAAHTIEYLSGYDVNTGLMKYERFIRNIGSMLPTIEVEKRAIFIYSNIGNIKYVTERLGEEAADKVLKEFAEHLKEEFQGKTLLARLGYDSLLAFAIVEIDEIENYMEEKVSQVNREFTEKMEAKYENCGLAINSGIYVVKDKNATAQKAVANANMARKKAEDTKRTCLVFVEQMDQEIKRAYEILGNMKYAMENKEFQVYYQQKVDAKNRKVVGAEALIRWQKADGTMIYPNQFIPIFEKEGVVVWLDYYVYESVCVYLRERLDAGLTVVPISMNVSRRHLQNQNLIIYVKELLEKYQIPPELLEFELTENIEIENLETMEWMFKELKKLGVKVSIDDFGSGYSSLNVLRKMPIDVLKLDRVFLEDFGENKSEEIIVSSVVNMAKQLEITVVCEGVETEEQAEFLEKIGCDLMQGYYFSRPVDVGTFNEQLEAV